MEIIVLQVVETVDNDTAAKSDAEDATPKRQPRTRIKAFQDLFEKTQPAPPNFDPDEAKWEYLKQKHNL
ncbi:hypothetical protein MiSe_28500 [Microseira wollei NIES-4236]|uniref:Uncharacterized protein n=1 Tax=Microseira wollei NIES-4236 TaxID=2530354 RepID=A0AAV3XBT6_9CYAN|nr:hypothetical protein [Microseira wollei]GET38096.1 hypothetical protein MiSe_28500 [Microseira wollei NIES-4236]